MPQSGRGNFPAGQVGEGRRGIYAIKRQAGMVRDASDMETLANYVCTFCQVATVITANRKTADILSHGRPFSVDGTPA
jgi:hypothetical protein